MGKVARVSCRRRRGVQRNFQLLASAVDRLGGVPHMLELEDCLAEQVQATLPRQSCDDPY